MPQRQSVNIATDLSVLGNNNFNVNFNLRFAPDEVIVRAINYSDIWLPDRHRHCR